MFGNSGSEFTGKRPNLYRYLLNGVNLILAILSRVHGRRNSMETLDQSLKLD